MGVLEPVGVLADTPLGLELMTLRIWAVGYDHLVPLSLSTTFYKYIAQGVSKVENIHHVENFYSFNEGEAKYFNNYILYFNYDLTTYIAYIFIFKGLRIYIHLIKDIVSIIATYSK